MPPVYPSTSTSSPVLLTRTSLSLRSPFKDPMPRGPTEGTESAPRTMGERNTRTLSASRSLRIDAESLAPPSTRRLVIPALPSSLNTPFRLTPLAVSLMIFTVAPRERASSTFSLFAFLVVKTKTPSPPSPPSPPPPPLSPTPAKTFAVKGVSKERSTTTLAGFLRPLTRRTESSGSSVLTVELPTITASIMERSLCTYLLDSIPVIHRERPEAVAILPSSVDAIFNITKGLCVVMYFAYHSIISRH